MLSARNPRPTLLLPLLAAGILALPSASLAQAHDDQSISTHMALLRPLVGNWKAVAEFHDKDGSLSYDVGTYKIRPILDGTYLEIAVIMHAKDHPEHEHSFIDLITYNPVSGHYDSTYFYSHWALRVMEEGDFDPVKQEFATRAFIPKEDGVRDESVHTTMNLSDQHRIEYMHYSRHSGEPAYRMDVSFTLTPDL